MSRIRSTDTKAEVALRRALWAEGVRGYRLHGRLPGRPDLVFSRARLLVFVDGGFWHGHPHYFTPGKSGAYWDRKIAGNVARDARNRRRLRRLGWRVMRVWDFDVERDPTEAARRVLSRL
jgi:DNA mismatch endonuclease (patch repair protein)